jgi:hypothetical protein
MNAAVTAMTHTAAPSPTLDACVRPEHMPARPSYDVHNADVPGQSRAMVERVIEVAFPCIAEHLALTPETWEADGRRGLWLWGVVEISAAADGTDLQIKSVSTDPDDEACVVSANLLQPISCFSFSNAMSPILNSAARECGLSPKALSGPAGNYIRRVFARTFQRYVDWNRLRRIVLTHLRLNPLLVSFTRRIVRNPTPARAAVLRVRSALWQRESRRPLLLRCPPSPATRSHRYSAVDLRAAAPRT